MQCWYFLSSMYAALYFLLFFLHNYQTCCSTFWPNLLLALDWFSLHVTFIDLQTQLLMLQTFQQATLLFVLVRYIDLIRYMIYGSLSENDEDLV